MKRTQIYVNEEHDKQLDRRAIAAHTTKSALIREAIAAYLARTEDATAALARFRAALDELEREPVALEDGAAYVERIRALDSKRQADLERRWR